MADAGSLWVSHRIAIRPITSQVRQSHDCVKRVGGGEVGAVLYFVWSHMDALCVVVATSIPLQTRVDFCRKKTDLRNLNATSW